MKLEKKKGADDEHFVLSDIMDTDIAECTYVVRFEPGEVITEEGTRPKYLLYLVSGRAKLYLSHDNGRITLINFLSAPCFIGEMELLDEDRLANGVKAITVCECYAIRLDECRDQLLKDTKFLRYICRFLSRKAIGNTTNYSLNQSYPLRNRLALFMLETYNLTCPVQNYEGSDSMRLFVAIQLSDEMKKTITGTLHDLKQKGVKGSYVPAQNLHLTLAFIGETDNPGAVKAALKDVSIKPFRLSISEMGTFDDLLWVGVKGNQGLSAAAKSVREALDAAGISYDNKKFVPHITIIRKASGNWKQVPAPKGEMMVKKISLMKTTFKDGKPVYSEVSI